ncbi:hypothetical protein OHS33_31210 [Streptomyces sp. NBC_00536]|uniref:hypothetical protein n=1 Tax=Streptomyces sp. NBC_00536 TaxID=2975769 RepID=UPI002E802049|nr:hypothetical protein [Streptomyces sp. NBC_00536]WUC82430.1 hypothetical protein OHS33_31210 [Streptomyces sp. NBC_00536]
MPTPPRATGRALLPVAALALALSLLCAACGGAGTGARQSAGRPAARPTATAPGSRTIQELAAALGCTAEVTVEADELREGACGTGQEAYRIATFTADAGQTAWLAESQAYGGTYLVGARWIVTAASPEALAPARERLGGTIESGATHMGSHAGHA